ncbi:hypothetical protein [Lysinibacillus sp. SGAir0095]|uniref:hypothetical protein n=1 Tax=Lysinibacillus sp. SGAir0095 TaxID=2070463 RepID=UPI00143DF3D1|nr:hypothetical protein [Lysinibacillus sp. SGAir0095]
MAYTKYLLAYSLGYIAVTLMLYFLFDWFSFTFLISSFFGLLLFAFILKGLLKTDN